MYYNPINFKVTKQLEYPRIWIILSSVLWLAMVNLKIYFVRNEDDWKEKKSYFVGYSRNVIDTKC